MKKIIPFFAFVFSLQSSFSQVTIETSNGKMKLAGISETGYDTIVAVTYPCNYFSCLKSGKYDYFTGNGKKLNTAPADTMYFFSPLFDGVPDTNGFFAIVTGSSTRSFPYESFDSYAANYGNENPEISIVKTHADLPLVTGGKLQLFNMRFSPLADNVEDLGLMYPLFMYNEQFFPSNFHFIAQLDTSTENKTIDYYYKTPAQLFDPSLVLVKSNGKWKLFMLKGFKEVKAVAPFLSEKFRVRVEKNIFILECNGKVCLIDASGKCLNNCDFDYAGNFREISISDSTTALRGFFRKQNKWGIIDGNGKIILPPLYSGITNLDDEYSLINKGGILKKIDYMIQTPTYDEYGNATGNTTKYPAVDSFYTGGKFGIINSSGKLIVPVEYDYVGLDESGEKFIGQKESKARNITVAYEKSPVRWLYRNAIEYYQRGEGGKFFVMSKKGKVEKILDADYLPVGARGYSSGEKKYYIKVKNGKKGLAGQGYKELFPPRYDELMPIYRDQDSMVFIAEKNGLKNIVSLSGKEILPWQFKYLAQLTGGFFMAATSQPASEKRTTVQNIEGNYDAIDYYFPNEKGKLIDYRGQVFQTGIDSCIATKIVDYRTDDYKLFSERKKGYADPGLFIPVCDTFYSSGRYDGNYILKAGKLYGAKTKAGFYFAPAADSAYFGDKYFYFRKQGKWGMCTSDGKEILKPEWKKITLHENYGKSSVELKTESGIGLKREGTGDWIIPPQYDSLGFSLTSFEYGIVVAYKEGKAELYTLAYNKKVSDEKYDDFYFGGDYYVGKKDGKMGFFFSDLTPACEIKFNSIVWIGDAQLYRLMENGKETFTDMDMKPVADGKSRYEKSVYAQFVKTSSAKINSFEWKPQEGPFGCDATTFMKDKDGSWWLGTGSSGGVFVSTDKGKSWKPRIKGTGPVHVLELNRLHDTIFMAAGASGDKQYQYPNAFKNDEWTRQFSAVFYFDKKNEEWKKIPEAEKAQRIFDSLRVTKDDAFAKFSEKYSVSEDYAWKISNAPLVIYKLDASGNKTDSIKTICPADFSEYSGIHMCESDEKIHLLCRSGMYIADFKTKKIERCGTEGLLATDVTHIHPLETGEVLVASGTNSIWKMKKGKWKVKADFWQTPAWQRVFNNIDYENISWNNKGEGIFLAEGNVYRISSDGEKTELLLKSEREKEPAFNANADECSWKGDNNFCVLFNKEDPYSAKKIKVYDAQTKKLVSSDSSEKYAGVKGFFMDGLKRNWVATCTGKFYCEQDSAATILDNLVVENNGAYRFFFFGNGNVLVFNGVDGKIYVWSNDSKTWVSFGLGAEVYPAAACVDKNGRIFLATNYKYSIGGCAGLDFYEGAAKLFYLQFTDAGVTPVEVENKINPRIISLAPHKDGGVWVGTSGSGLWWLKY